MAFKMNITKPNAFRYLFKTLCTICVICMVGYWFYKFDVEDRDIGIVDYTSFEDDSRINYPVASFCFNTPFSQEKVSRNNSDLNITYYLSYLQGDVVEQIFQNVDYFSVTLDLDDYLTRYLVTLRNGTDVEGSQIGTFSHQVNFNGVSEWGWFYKCFELKWEIIHPGAIRESYIAYNMTEILQDVWGDSSLDFYLYVHYPGQFLLAPNDFTYMTFDSTIKSFEVTIEDVEMLRSRNSKNRRCTIYHDKPSFDDMVKDTHTMKSGCVLPYFRPVEHFTSCETSEKIKASTFKYQNVRTKYYPISCHRLSKISYRTQKYDNHHYLGFAEDELGIGIVYPQYFRSIELTKEVDVHSLIGNIGGYVGLFLGNFTTKEEKYERIHLYP